MNTRMKRIDGFKGTKAEYIIYLESLITKYRPNSGTSTEPTTISSRVGPQLERVSSGYEVFVITPPDTHLNGTTKALEKFLHAVNPASKWMESRTTAGMASVERNKWTIRFLVDDPSLTTADFPTPLQPHEWEHVRYRVSELEHAQRYSQRKKQLKADKSLLGTIHRFGELVFVQWCTLMIRKGQHPVEKVEEMMGSWFGLTASKTMRRYRCGGSWTSRLTSELCIAGWGEQAFELFAIHGKPVATYGSFADKMAESTRRAREHLTKTEYIHAVDREDGWITPCSPCIVKCLADQSYEADNCYDLKEICKILGFNDIATQMVLKIWNRDYSDLYRWLRHARAQPSRKRLREDAGDRCTENVVVEGTAAFHTQPQAYPAQCHVNTMTSPQSSSFQADLVDLDFDVSVSSSLGSQVEPRKPVDFEQYMASSQSISLVSPQLTTQSHHSTPSTTPSQNMGWIPPTNDHLQSPALHSPSPPQALLVAENLFHDIKVYFENSCRNMILDDHGTLLNQNGTESHNDLCNDFDSYCFTATMFMGRQLHVEFRHALSKASALVEQILRAEHPRTLACFLEVFIHLIQTGLPEVTSALRGFIKRMSAKVIRKGHPWGQICHLLGELESESLDQAMAQIWKCTADTFESELGTFSRLAVSVRLDYIKRVYGFTNYLGEERLLRDLLDQFDGIPRVPTPRVMLNLARNLNRQGRYDEAEEMAQEVFSLLQGYEIYAKRIAERIECMKIVSESQFNQGKTLAAEQTMRGAIRMIVDQWGVQHSWVLEFMNVLEGWVRNWGREEDANTLRGEIEGLMGEYESYEQLNGLPSLLCEGIVGDPAKAARNMS